MDGPIPWTAVSLYAKDKELDRDNAEVLWNVIRKMDAAERKWVRDNPEPTTKEEPPVKVDDG